MLVCLPVFKTGTDGEQPLGWVRFPHAPAKVRAALLGGSAFDSIRISGVFLFFWLNPPQRAILLSKSTQKKGAFYGHDL